MKKLLILLFLPILSSYGQENTDVSPDLSDITISNFPIIDGSDSTEPLRLILMCKLVGFNYEWMSSPFVQNPEEATNWVMPK